MAFWSYMASFITFSSATTFLTSSIFLPFWQSVGGGLLVGRMAGGWHSLLLIWFLVLVGNLIFLSFWGDVSVPTTPLLVLYGLLSVLGGSVDMVSSGLFWKWRSYTHNGIDG